MLYKIKEYCLYWMKMTRNYLSQLNNARTFHFIISRVFSFSQSRLHHIYRQTFSINASYALDNCRIAESPAVITRIIPVVNSATLAL